MRQSILLILLFASKIGTSYADCENGAPFGANTSRIASQQKNNAGLNDFKWLTPGKTSLAKRLPTVFKKITDEAVSKRETFRKAYKLQWSFAEGEMPTAVYFEEYIKLTNKLASQFSTIATELDLGKRSEANSIAAEVFDSAAKATFIPTSQSQISKSSFGKTLLKIYRQALELIAKEEDERKLKLAFKKTAFDFTAGKIASIWFELFIAFNLDGVIEFNADAWELWLDSQLLNKPPRHLADTEVDIVTLVDGRYSLYEVKYYKQPLGARESWAKVKSQLLRQKELASLFHSSRTRVIVVAHSGFTAEAQTWLRANDIEMLGPGLN